MWQPRTAQDLPTDQELPFSSVALGRAEKEGLSLRGPSVCMWDTLRMARDLSFTLVRSITLGGREEHTCGSLQAGEEPFKGRSSHQQPLL